MVVESERTRFRSVAERQQRARSRPSYGLAALAPSRRERSFATHDHWPERLQSILDGTGLGDFRRLAHFA